MGKRKNIANVVNEPVSDASSSTKTLNNIAPYVVPLIDQSLQNSSTLLAVESAAGVCKPDEAPPPPPRSVDAGGEEEEEVGTKEQIGMLVPLHFGRGGGGGGGAKEGRKEGLDRVGRVW